MKIHDLKVWTTYWLPMRNGEKTFEIRRNDRGYEVGDILFLREWNEKTKDYTGRMMLRRVTYMVDLARAPGWYIEKDVYLVMAIVPVMVES